VLNFEAVRLMKLLAVPLNVNLLGEALNTGAEVDKVPLLAFKLMSLNVVPDAL
jgi:hypothetical protein